MINSLLDGIITMKGLKTFPMRTLKTLYFPSTLISLKFPIAAKIILKRQNQINQDANKPQ